MNKKNIYKLLLIISVAINIILVSNFYSYKNTNENDQNNKLSSLQVSSMIILNISKNLMSNNIDPEYLKEQRNLYISLASLNQDIPEYEELIKPMSTLIFNIENNKFDKEEIQKFGQELNIKTRDLLTTLSKLSESITIKEVFEKASLRIQEIKNTFMEMNAQK